MFISAKIFQSIRPLLQILGPTMTIVGLIISAWGSFLLTRWYHSFSFIDFLRMVARVSLFYASGRARTAELEAETMTNLTEKHEERPKSLIGIYFIFSGFLVQAVGALCWGADVVWGICCAR
jgi:hypothetical protein